MFWKTKTKGGEMLGEIDLSAIQDETENKKPAKNPFLSALASQTDQRVAPDNSVSMSPKSGGNTPNISSEKATKLTKEQVEAIEKSNPFFQQKKDNSPVYIKENEEKKHYSKISFRKISIIVTIVVIVFGLAGTGFYLLTTKTFPFASRAPKPSPVPPVEPSPVPEPELVPIAPETPKPQYLVIDFENSTADQIRQAIVNKKQEVTGVLSDRIMEYLIADTSNKPVGFKIFSSKLGLVLSESVMANILDNFIFYYYNDKGNIGLSLAIDVINEDQLRTDLGNSEPNLVRDLEPLLTIIKPEFKASNLNKSVVFTKVSYKKFITSSYFNVISPNELSIDYAVYNKKLIIGTTKMTFQKTMEHLENNETEANNLHQDDLLLLPE